jgi:hypothetical protein
VLLKWRRGWRCGWRDFVKTPLERHLGKPEKEKALRNQGLKLAEWTGLETDLTPFLISDLL